MNARELLDIAADYADMRQTIALNPSMFAEAEGNDALDKLAARYEAALGALTR